MSRGRLDRRQFLTLPLALLFAPVSGALAEPAARTTTYGADVGILWKALTFELTGALEEVVDRAAGRYEVRAVGKGASIANRVESRGIMMDGRWAPLKSVSWFQVADRVTQTEITYDYDRRTAHYQYRGETFFLRKERVADDTLVLPEGQRVDDVGSAVLNYADGIWAVDGDGAFRTHVVRRRRPEKEGPDDVQKSYRAELVPLVLRVEPDPDTGRPTALFDLTRFSGWAREGKPARIVFGADRRPQAISVSLILGTSVSIRLGGTGKSAG